MILIVCVLVTRRKVFKTEFSRGMSTTLLKAEICSVSLEQVHLTGGQGSKMYLMKLYAHTFEV